MGEPNGVDGASPRVPPQSEDFQETAQIVPPDQVRRIEADPAHGGGPLAAADPSGQASGANLWDTVPAERDEPVETRASQPPTTVVDWPIKAGGDRPPEQATPPDDPRDQHAGPGHAADDRAMQKDPDAGYDVRHRPQASDFYQIARGSAPMPSSDAGRQRRAATPSPTALVKGAGIGFLVAGAALGLAALAARRLWTVSRR
jgi:hypothetical protein